MECKGNRVKLPPKPVVINIVKNDLVKAGSAKESKVKPKKPFDNGGIGKSKVPFDKIDLHPAKKSRDTSSVISEGNDTEEEVFENLEKFPVKYEKFKNKTIKCKVVLKRIDFSPKGQRSDAEHIQFTKAVSDFSNKKHVSLEDCRTSSLILQNAKVSKSASTGLCQFDCLECHESFFSWRMLCRHAVKEHNIRLVSANFENFLYEAVVHVCRICLETVLCDSTFLFIHFQYKHHLSIGEYRKNYDCHTSQNVVQTKFRELLVKAEISENKIGNLCSFQCVGCKGMYKSLSTFKSHNSTIFHCPLKGQFLQWETSLVKVVTHRCKLCSKLILCDTRTIMSHVRPAHGMKSIGEYAKKTGSILNVPGKEFEHGAAHNVLCKNAPTVEKAGDFCTFKCHKCGHISHQWADMKRHLKRLGHGTCEMMWHKYITKVVLHTCRICNRKVLNDSQFWGNHANKCHQMTWTDYRKGCKSK